MLKGGFFCQIKANFAVEMGYLGEKFVKNEPYSAYETLSVNVCYIKKSADLSSDKSADKKGAQKLFYDKFFCTNCSVCSAEFDHINAFCQSIYLNWLDATTYWKVYSFGY